MGRLVRAEMESKGVRVFTDRAVQGIERKDGNVLVQTASGENYPADMVLVAAGVEPSTMLAQSAGVALGVARAIQVDRTMATNLPDIFAAGDCAETWHRILQRNVYMPLGTTAHKQGRVVGENMLGGRREFQGSLGTQAVKVFDLIAAGTGLRDAQASKAGFEPLTVMLTNLDRNAYYAGVQEINICITGDCSSGRLLGAQMVGHYGSEIAKRIDIIATALFNDMSVEDLCDLDLSYTPPVSSPWDPVQKAAMEWLAARGR
jgi:NADPH-dependent 2,4-dienoyl-CoA reductase/sulfur reductase-like enzyme